jgi:GT2 family glycosyltransferase
MTHRISLVVATKDRPDDLRKMLDSLRNQTMVPAEIIVVDASTDSVEQILLEFPTLSIQYLRHLPPSAAAQRNVGILACAPDATLIGFADDDIIFEPQAFECLIRFWDNEPAGTLGAAFNLRNYPQRSKSLLKRSKISEALGLYSSRPGTVSRSGWQTIIPGLSETQYVDWLPTTAVTFRREALQLSLFDNFYESYSYLEDVDLSYTISRAGRLAVVADAGYSHFPSPSGRVSLFQFGRLEVRNRIHFVRKHHLSLSRCYLGLAIRMVMTMTSAITHLDVNTLQRTRGNLVEMVAGRDRQELNLSVPASKPAPVYESPEEFTPKKS